MAPITQQKQTPGVPKATVPMKNDTPVIKDVEQLKANLKEEKRARSVETGDPVVKSKNDDDEESRKRRKVDEAGDSEGEIIDGPIAKVHEVKKAKTDENDVVDDSTTGEQNESKEEPPQKELPSKVDEKLVKADSKVVEVPSEGPVPAAHDGSNNTEPTDDQAAPSLPEDKTAMHSRCLTTESGKENSTIPQPATIA